MVPKTPASNFRQTMSRKTRLHWTDDANDRNYKPKTPSTPNQRRTTNRHETPACTHKDRDGGCSTLAVSGHFDQTHFKPAAHKQQARLGLPNHLPELLGGGLPETHCVTMNPKPSLTGLGQLGHPQWGLVQAHNPHTFSTFSTRTLIPHLCFSFSFSRDFFEPRHLFPPEISPAAGDFFLSPAPRLNPKTSLNLQSLRLKLL